MRSISQAHKQRAQEDLDRSANLSLVAGFLGTAIGAPVTAVLPPIGVGVSVAFAVWVAALGRHIAVVQRVVRDPPDREFQSVTRLSSAKYDLELLAIDDFGQANLAALRALTESTNAASAMVRALERSQGAALAGAFDFEEQRFTEALEFSSQLGRTLEIFADSTPQVIDAARSLPSIPQALPRGGRLMDLLSDEVLAELYRLGVPRGDLNVPVVERVNEDPINLFERRVREVTVATRNYTELLTEGINRSFGGTINNEGT